MNCNNVHCAMKSEDEFLKRQKSQMNNIVKRLF